MGFKLETVELDISGLVQSLANGHALQSLSVTREEVKAAILEALPQGSSLYELDGMLVRKFGDKLYVHYEHPSMVELPAGSAYPLPTQKVVFKPVWPLRAALESLETVSNKAV